MPPALQVPQNVASTRAVPPRSTRASLRAHFRILRLDHSIKQAFIVPGILLGLAITGRHVDLRLALTICAGMLAATLISSSNYVINELLDAPFDRMHPVKKARPAACGLVRPGGAYAQWIVLMIAGIALGRTISTEFVLCAAALWVMGCAYNIRPLRTKDVPYVDVLTESINNPIRFCLGWYMVTQTVLPPLSLLVAYWMLGAYFMGLKRFSEYRQIDDSELAGSYRKSFRFYTQESLLISVIFYAAAAMLFFGAFLMRYRIELILTFPLVAWLMAIYFGLSFRFESAVQNPEKLYREPRLMTILILCVLAFGLFLFVDVPWLTTFFPKSHR
jgi:decaprenyl-phosphate phosphoribosyltransferase